MWYAPFLQIVKWCLLNKQPINEYVLHSLNILIYASVTRCMYLNNFFLHQVVCPNGESPSVIRVIPKVDTCFVSYQRTIRIFVFIFFKPFAFQKRDDCLPSCFFKNCKLWCMDRSPKTLSQPCNLAGLHSLSVL